MDAILKIWNTFVTSNTFNFFVMLAIIFWIIKKADISNLFKKSVLVIKNKITDSENAKETEILNLNEAKKSVKNLDVEIKNIIEDAEQKAENLKNNILSEANVKVKNFGDNVVKIIDAEEKQASSRLINDTLKQSNEKAVQKIIRLLEENPELHAKIIDKCIGQII